MDAGMIAGMHDGWMASGAKIKNKSETQYGLRSKNKRPPDTDGRDLGEFG